MAYRADPLVARFTRRDAGLDVCKAAAVKPNTDAKPEGQVRHKGMGRQARQLMKVCLLAIDLFRPLVDACFAHVAGVHRDVRERPPFDARQRHVEHERAHSVSAYHAQDDARRRLWPAVGLDTRGWCGCPAEPLRDILPIYEQNVAPHLRRKDREQHTHDAHMEQTGGHHNGMTGGL